jgi:hypothetical protein
VSPRCCFDESSNGPEQSAWIALSFTLRKKAERSTNDSDSLQAMRCDWRAIRFYVRRLRLIGFGLTRQNRKSCAAFIASACSRSRSPINPEPSSSRAG